MTAAALAEIWPAAGVYAQSGDLELRWIDDDLLVALAQLAGKGIHVEDRMPFAVPWTRGTPEDVARSVIAFQWAARAKVAQDGFTLELAALVNGQPVGIQSASAIDWQALRRAETGSWLGRASQGAGIGTRMRALMLELLFDGLGAAEVTSGAFEDNPASAIVSRRTGYLENGSVSFMREGVAVEHTNFRMLRDRWLEVRDANRRLLGAPIELVGAQALRAFID